MSARSTSARPRVDAAIREGLAVVRERPVILLIGAATLVEALALEGRCPIQGSLRWRKPWWRGGQCSH